MATIASETVYEPRALPVPEVEALAHSVYHEVVTPIFGVLTEQAFTDALTSTVPVQSWLQVLRNEDDLPVGFQFIRLFEEPFDGATCGIFRALSGLLPAYRGQNRTTTFGLKRWFSYRAKHPRRRVFYGGPLVHPTSYSLLAKYAPTMWPIWHSPTPPHVEQFLRDTADRWGLEPVDAARPLVRDAHTSTHETEKERAYWAVTDRPAARYFVDQVPDYAAGYGLMTLVPLTGRLIRHTLSLSAGQFVRSQAAALEHRLQQRGLRITLLPRPDPAPLLKNTSLFRSVDDDALAQLVQSADVVTVESGQYLFRQGDPGDRLYIIVRGTAEVVLEGTSPHDPADGEVLDALGYGEVVGEMALLTGEPRNASIRAATLLKCVQIRQSALEEIMRHAETRDAIWASFTARRFDNYLRTLQRFTHLSQDDRRDWIARSPQVVLGPGETFEPDAETAHIFLVTGEAEVDIGGTRVALRAPALVGPRPGLRAQSLLPVRLVPLPVRGPDAS